MQQDMEGQMNNQVALELGNNRLQIMQQQITIGALSQQLAAAQAQVLELTPKSEADEGVVKTVADLPQTKGAA